MPTARPAPTASPGARFLARRVREVFAPYPKALAGDAEAVHRLRVASRRLRVALPLLAAAGGRRVRRAGRLLRDLARAAGSCRDLDVGAELVTTLGPREDGGSAAAALRRSLIRARRRGRARAREMLLDLDVARLRRDLRSILAAGAAGDDEVRRRIAERAGGEHAKLAARRASTGRRFEPAALHEIRRRARRLRYAAEVAEALLAEPPHDSERWRKVQTRLGEINDRVVLARWLEASVARAARRGDLELAGLARSVEERILRDARRRHRAYLEREAARAAAPPAEASVFAV